jgi:hypothetical protein
MKVTAEKRRWYRIVPLCASLYLIFSGTREKYRRFAIALWSYSGTVGAKWQNLAGPWGIFRDNMLLFCNCWKSLLF